MQTDHGGERRVGVYRVRVRLDKVTWFGKRYVPMPSLAIPTCVDVYRIDSRHYSRESIPCSTSEERQWAAAGRAYCDRALRADDDLYRAHWGWRARLTLDRSSLWEPPPPFPWPGWERRLATRSEKAQRAFVAALKRAAEEYRPVRAEIERRLEKTRREVTRVNVPHWAAADVARPDEERQRRERQEIAARQVSVRHVSAHHSNHGVGLDETAASDGTAVSDGGASGGYSGGNSFGTSF